MVRAGAEAGAVEHEELGLGPEVGGVADAALLQVELGALRDVARIADVGLARDRIDDVADQHERRVLR